MKKVYIAGKVTGVPQEQATQKFNTAEKLVTVAGFQAVNPIKIVNDVNAEWQKAMRVCITSLMQCDAVLILPCVWRSKGAQIERELASNLNLPIFYTIKELEAWNN